MHARIPNGLMQRGVWLNLCLDINSFVKECFTQSKVPGSSEMAQRTVNNNSMKNIEAI
jgi:hypothetical protein